LPQRGPGVSIARMTLSTTSFPSQTALDFATRLRPRVRSGDILLCAGLGVFSHLIQQATGSIWSHVGLVWHWPGLDQLVVFESVESVGVRMVPLEKYLHNYDNNGQSYPGSMVLLGHTRYPKGLPLELEEPIVRHAIEQLGHAYNKQEVLRLAARIAAARLSGAELQAKGLTPQREFICSEYVTHCLAQAGLGLPLNQFGFVSPADFAQSKALMLRGVIKPRVYNH
jgi:hypothetical protein